MDSGALLTSISDASVGRRRRDLKTRYWPKAANRSQSLVSGKLWTIQASGNGLTQVFPRGTIDLGVVLGLVRYRRAAVFCWGVRL